VNRQRLLATFLRLTQVDSPSHAETNLAQLLTTEFAERGWHMRTDSSGNVIASVAGDSQQAPLLFASHMDVVMPCRGVRPKITDGVIHSSGDTVLGADAKASIAAMLKAASALSGNHPPIEFVFTVGEEVGHLGAKALDISALKAEHAWVLDGLVPVARSSSQHPPARPVRAARRADGNDSGDEPLGPRFRASAVRCVAPIGLDVPVSVNLSMRDLQHPELLRPLPVCSRSAESRPQHFGSRLRKAA
jgi:tripeptide aminopeptidase